MRRKRIVLAWWNLFRCADCDRYFARYSTWNDCPACGSWRCYKPRSPHLNLSLIPETHRANVRRR